MTDALIIGGAHSGQQLTLEGEPSSVRLPLPPTESVFHPIYTGRHEFSAAIYTRRWSIGRWMIYAPCEMSEREARDFWLPIDTAPQDGTVIELKRIPPNGSPIIGFGCWSTFHDAAPMCSPMAPDPLNRLSAADYAAEEAYRLKTIAEPTWLWPDRMYRFPMPHFWRPVAEGVAR